MFLCPVIFFAKICSRMLCLKLAKILKVLEKTKQMWSIWENTFLFTKKHQDKERNMNEVISKFVDVKFGLEIKVKKFCWLKFNLKFSQIVNVLHHRQNVFYLNKYFKHFFPVYVHIQLRGFFTLNILLLNLKGFFQRLISTKETDGFISKVENSELMRMLFWFRDFSEWHCNFSHLCDKGHNGAL